MPPAIIAWIALGLSVASFAVFAILALRKPPAPPPPERNPADAQPQGMAMPQVGEVADLAEKLGKAGPSATAASLSIFFFGGGADRGRHRRDCGRCRRKRGRGNRRR